MRVRCRHCGVAFQIRESDAGKRGRCPNGDCQQPFKIPAAKPTSTSSDAKAAVAPQVKPTKQKIPAKRQISAELKPVKVPAAAKGRSGKSSAGKRNKKRTASKQMATLRWSLIGLVGAIVVVTGVVFLQQGEEPVAQQLVAAEVPPSTSFEGDVQPFLKKYCFDCHGPDYSEGELNFGAYETPSQIVDHREEWTEILKILRVGAMPPSDADQPASEERQMVIDWLDHQLFFVDCNTDHDPGRVTVHRLNRTEYNNTVQDLLGVDFKPAGNFPSDDVGYGFDNIGDVLSVPPLLIEKYLDAAEEIAAKSIPLAHPQHTQQLIVGRRLKEEGSVSPGPDESKVMPSHGRVFEQFDFPADGRYAIRIEAGATQAGDEPAKMKVRLEKDDLEVIEIKKHKERETFQMIVDVKAGKREVSAAFINDFYDEDAEDREHRDRNLYVGSIEVEGPLDIPAADFRAETLVSVTPESGVSAAEAARVNLQQFLPRAFRREVTADEVEQYVKFVELATEQGESFRGSMRVALQAILVSPHFLFRVEDGRRREGDYEVIDDYALASRLSYFLWSTMPDDELFNVAAQGKLHEEETLRTQTERMLRDPRVEALVKNFSGQWLGLRQLTTNEVAPDPKLFPEFNDQLRKDIWNETELFFGSVVLSDRSVFDLLTGNYTFLNERLAKFYGIDGVTGEGFRKVDLSGYPRAGVMTHASILTLTSYPNRTSPVKRGQWVLENLLGDAPPDPPPNAPGIEETQDSNPNLSFREQLVLHRADPGCASCHVVMDEIGFGLQNFDAIGKWRTEEDGHPVDATGKLPTGETFEGPTELINVLTNRKTDFARCLTEKLMTYALGRGMEYYDKCSIDQILANLEENDQFSTLVMGIVKSAPFQSRRIKE